MEELLFEHNFFPTFEVRREKIFLGFESFITT